MTQAEEDDRDLELCEELRKAYEEYLHAPECGKATAKKWYLLKLREFRDRVTR